MGPFGGGGVGVGGWGGLGRRPLINWPINPSGRIDNAQFARIHAAGDAGTGPHSAARVEEGC